VINETLLYEFENPLFGNKGRFEVSLQDPAVARVTSEATYACSYGESDYLISAVCKTSSDAAFIRHEANVSILVNGKLHWQKKWAAEAPREYF